MSRLNKDWVSSYHKYEIFTSIPNIIVLQNHSTELDTEYKGNMKSDR